MQRWGHTLAVAMLALLLAAFVGMASNLVSLHRLRSLAMHDFALMRREGAPTPKWLGPNELRAVSFADVLPCPASELQSNFTILQRLLLPRYFLRPKSFTDAGPVWAYLQVKWWFFPFLAQTRRGSYEGMQGYRGWSSSSYDLFTCHLCLFGAVIEVTSGGSTCLSN